MNVRIINFIHDVIGNAKFRIKLANNQIGATQTGKLTVYLV